MADFDFTQLKGRMAQAGKGGHVELSDLERNALITNAIDGGSVDPEEVQELIDESLEGYYNKFEVDSELNTKSDKADTYTKSEVNALIPSVDNDIIIGALPSSGVPNTIYRVPGTNSYTDYAWDGTQFVALGTFTGNGDIDATPTANSANPVQSGGVYKELYGQNEDQSTNAGTASSYWKDNNGVIGYATSGMGLHRADYIAVTSGYMVSMTTTLGSTTAAAAYFCDDSGNIVQTIPNGTLTYNDVVPVGATRLYINYLSTYSFSTQGNLSKLSSDVESLADEVGELEPLKSLSGWTELFDSSNTTMVDKKWIDGTTGEENGYLYESCSPYIPITPKALIKFSANGSTSTMANMGYALYNENKVYVSGEAVGANYHEIILVVPDNVRYIRTTCSAARFFVREKILGVSENVAEELAETGARKPQDNTSAIPLTDWDFVSGILQGSTGAEVTELKGMRSGYIEIISGCSVQYSVNSGYSCTIFTYDENKNYIWNSATAQSGNVTTQSYARYMRISLLQSASGRPVYDDIGLSLIPSKVYVPTRAAAEDTLESVVNDVVGEHYSLELPIYAPSPQLPANSLENSDFNAETATSADIYSALDNLISSLSSPDKGTMYYPKVLNKYDVSGLDASGVYPIYTYAFGRSNRYAWRYANELYAWKDGSNNIVYIDSCSPHVGDVIYSNSSRTASGKTISSYNSTTGTMADSSSTSYTRASSSDIQADMFWTKLAISKSATTSSIYGAFDRSDNSLGNATFIDATHLSFGGKSYVRSECFDYHTDQKATIFIWGNEHGPTSDPLEPSIILYRLAKDLVGGCKNNPFLMFLKQYCKVVFIPCANPWGCQYPRVNGRVNSNGVNLNRNYDTTGWAVQESSERGTYAGDQSETQYIMNMCKRFTPNIAIDNHCLGYGNELAEGLMYLSETDIPNNDLYQKTRETMRGLGYLFDHRGDFAPTQEAHGSDWINVQGMFGGVFEMNAGAYSANHIYNGKQHTELVMEACYTELLNCIRMWLYEVEPTLDLSGICIK